MKSFRILLIPIFTFLILFPFPGSSQSAAPSDTPVDTHQSAGNIYLYGEQHAVEKILKKEIEIWQDYYNNHGLRHLFLETPYYTAEFLNLWMRAETDEILDRIYDDWAGTASHNPVVKEFFLEIKSRCPETIFHGTDVGHQYQSTGIRYLDYLSRQHKENTTQHLLAKEAIEQGKLFYEKRNGAYRENMMTANFVREFSSLNDESVMGIYGTAHTGINLSDNSTAVLSMATQLYHQYGEQLSTVNLASSVKDNKPIRMESMQINGSDYKALYFGKQDLPGTRDYKSREFWRLEGAYDDFKMASKTGDVLPCNRYPMQIETEQVFVIDYMRTDGTLIRRFYRSDGKLWNNRPTTVEFSVE